MKYYTTTIKVFISDPDDGHARETIQSAFDSLVEDNSIIEWGYVKTGENTRAFPTLVKDQTFAANLEECLDRQRGLEAEDKSLTDKEQEELQFLDEDNEQSFDNL